jgi:hypothetical protein
MSCQEHKITTQEQKPMEIVWIEPEKFVKKTHMGSNGNR